MKEKRGEKGKEMEWSGYDKSRIIGEKKESEKRRVDEDNGVE